MIIDKENSKHIIAESGMIFQRISDDMLFGNEIYLGITYYINGEKLDSPFMELPEHFIEIPNPKLNVLNYIEDAVIVE